MGGETICIVLLGALTLLLVSAGVEDARTREIANWKNAAIALLAPLWWWTNATHFWPDLAIQLGIAAILFALFVGAFAAGWMGGGDVKMIGAIALWLPFQPLASMLVTMSLIGGVLTLVMVIERAVRRNSGAIEIPYGVAIALAGLLAIREPLFNQFR
ncbi:MAG: prepilin peptidase [Sphingomonas sp.]